MSAPASSVLVSVLGGTEDDETTPLLVSRDRLGRPAEPVSAEAKTQPPPEPEEPWGARRNLQISVFLGFGLVVLFLRTAAGGWLP